MLVSYNWLKSFFENPPPPEPDIFERIGIEVESIKEVPESFSGIEVVEVKGIREIDERLKHVELSNGKFVVCGAPNVRIGLRTLYINPGSKLNGRQITVKSIKGFDSRGMLLSAFEAGIGKDAHKIIELLPSTELLPLDEHFELPDIIFDVNIPPNQAFLLSHYGVAYYISRFFDFKINREYKFYVPKNRKMDFDFEIKSPNCTSYMLLKFDELKDYRDLKIIGRLYKMGLKSINAAVDITNYTLFGFGHPSHAFDASKITGKKIYINDAALKEQAIDGNTYEFDGCLIMDESKAIAAGGVIGFINSEVDENTRTIVVEIANFKQEHIRMHSKKTVSTPSSYRFERGLSEFTMIIAYENIVNELSKISNFTGLKVNIRKPQVSTHTFNIKDAFNFLGIEYEKKPVIDFLKRISLDFKLDGDRVKMKTYSFFGEIIEDIYEEILKFTGFSAIKTNPVKSKPVINGFDIFRSYMISNGFYEAYSTGLAGSKVAQFFGSPVKILNPHIKDFDALRTSIIPDIVNIIETNISYGLTDVRIFEVGSVWRDGVESTYLACGYYDCSLYWIKIDENQRFYWFKGVFEGLLGLTGKSFKFNLHPHPFFDILYKDGDILFGVKKLKTGFAFLFELPLEGIKFKSKYIPASTYPPSYRDISIFVDKAVEFGSVEDVVKETSKPFLESIELFDVYDHGNRKSFTFRVVLRGLNSTLTGEDVNKIVENIFLRLKDKLGATARVL